MDVVKILSDLVRIDTSSPSGENYEKVIDYLEPLFLSVGCQTQKIFIPEEYANGLRERVNLLVHRRNLGKPRLIFYTHIDVVPAKDWDAFNPKIESGKLYGRGAADTKGAIPALLLALEKTREKPVNYDISVMVTTDEETEQRSQLKYLSAFIDGLENSYIFDSDSSFGGVTIATLGAIHLEVVIKGKSVHSGLSHLGENAVEKSVKILIPLLRLKSRVEARFSKVAVDPDFGISHLQAKLNINEIHGGLAVNIVPDECVIGVDRRIIPEEDLNDAEKEITRALSRVEGVKYEIRNIRRFGGFLTDDPDDPIVDKLNRVIKQQIGESDKYGVPGSGELCDFAKTHQAKLFGIGVIRSESNTHGRDEFVYIKDIEDLAEIIERFLVS